MVRSEAWNFGTEVRFLPSRPCHSQWPSVAESAILVSMTKIRAFALTACLFAALALTACVPLPPPIPTAQTQQVQIGMELSQVFEILGVSFDQLNDTGGPDDFRDPSDPIDRNFLHVEYNWQFRGSRETCQQTINMQFKNYLDGAQGFHRHLDVFVLTNYDVTLSSGCNGVVK
jgi:hypothetical protein